MTYARSFPAVLLVATVAAASAFGQGSLTPPGAPAPTMKTLDQVEARTPLTGGTATVTINANGSYYLTGNITVASGDGVVINANGVTLDLNGFTISSSAPSPGSGSGIISSGHTGVTIRHGRILGTTTVSGATFTLGGFAYGVSTSGRLVRVEDLQVSGVANEGIFSSADSVIVSYCQVHTIPTGGIDVPLATGCEVEHCAVHACGGNAISAFAVRDSSGNALTGGAGIIASKVGGSSGVSATGYGITADLVTDSKGVSNGGGSGINATGAVLGSYGSSISSYGIYGNTVGSSYGNTNTGIGIGGGSVVNCTGNSAVSGAAISATTVSGSYGYAQTAGIGVQSGSVATACYGAATSGTGIQAGTATNCTGYTGGTTAASRAVDCTGGVAIGCRCIAYSANAATLIAAIGNSCVLVGTGTDSITHRYNMP